VFKTASILACLLALVTGCTTEARRVSESRPPDWESAENRIPSPEPAPPPEVAVAAPQVAPAAATQAGPPRATAPELTWISLARWSAQHGLGEPHRLSVAPVSTRALLTTNGVLVVQAGSLAAYWDHLELRLGFTPQLIGNQVFLHALDLRKNVEPLVRGFTGVARTNRVIVIDPGHGGADPGARSAADGRWEKDFTLDWARRLAALLEQRGWQPFLTRNHDADVSLSDRVALADARGADLFLSLHFNTSGGAHEQAGLETYCLTPTGMRSSLTRGYEDDPTEVLPNNAFDAENVQWAIRLHAAMLSVDGVKDRGVRRARFLGVLRTQKRPAVLIEGGFLSNPAEAQRIADPAFRQKLAEALARALETKLENER
jgi:N-acetylmuramoyl-L-alanine amidase